MSLVDMPKFTALSVDQCAGYGYALRNADHRNIVAFQSGKTDEACQDQAFAFAGCIESLRELVNEPNNGTLTVERCAEMWARARQALQNLEDSL